MVVEDTQPDRSCRRLLNRLRLEPVGEGIELATVLGGQFIQALVDLLTQLPGDLHLPPSQELTCQAHQGVGRMPRVLGDLSGRFRSFRGATGQPGFGGLHGHEFGQSASGNQREELPRSRLFLELAEHQRETDATHVVVVSVEPHRQRSRDVGLLDLQQCPDRCHLRNITSNALSAQVRQHGERSSTLRLVPHIRERQTALTEAHLLDPVHIADNRARQPHQALLRTQLRRPGTVQLPPQTLHLLGRVRIRRQWGGGGRRPERAPRLADYCPDRRGLTGGFRGAEGFRHGRTITEHPIAPDKHDPSGEGTHRLSYGRDEPSPASPAVRRSGWQRTRPRQFDNRTTCGSRRS